MTMPISISSRGRHTSAHQTLRTELRQAEADNRSLTAAVEDRERELHTALVRGCQDAMLIAHLREQLAGAVVGIRQTQHSLVRSRAEQERLRQAVVNARPRIQQVDTELVRPFSPVVELPYVSPVPYRDTSNDATQQLPVVDRPG